MSRIDEEMGQRIWALAKQGRSDRAIVAALGHGAPSRATVARYLLSIRGHVRAGKGLKGRSAAPLAPPASPEDTDRLVSLLQVTADVSAGPRDLARLALLVARDEADTREAVAAAERELARHDDPFLASRLDCGDPPVTALYIAGHAVAILSAPQDLADLARLVSEDPRPVVREPGETLAAHRREWIQARDADQTRAVELLRAALAIVETTDPPAYPREARP